MSRIFVSSERFHGFIILSIALHTSILLLFIIISHDRSSSGSWLDSDRIEKNVFTIVSASLWLVLDFFDEEHLLDHLHEPEVGAPAPFEAEVAHGVGAQELLKGRNEKGKRWLKVDAIGGQDDVRVRWDVVW
jgi:hypothetical protein